MTAAAGDSLQAALNAALQTVGGNVRLETTGDLSFCAALFALTREADLAQTPWSDEMKQAFCQQQFTSQHTFYRQHYPDADYLVIEQGDAPVGRVYIDSTPTEERLMEITLLRESRGRGIGTAITSAIVQRAHARGVAATLHVEPSNPARHLYERQGFREIEVQGFYAAMRCDPPATR